MVTVDRKLIAELFVVVTCLLIMTIYFNMFASVVLFLLELTRVRAQLSAQTWVMLEVDLTSNTAYNNPVIDDFTLNATFTGPSGETITRPGFWDGDTSWKIRFAPTVSGTWSMSTSCSETGDTGLNGITQTIDVSNYSGDLAIYQHGFVTPAVNGPYHYLAFADGTPFFYLGDTHWIMPHERFNTSNADGVSSQFLYSLDKRVSQGFTVYQSEAIWQEPPHNASDGAPDEEPQAQPRDGFNSSDLAGYQQIDAKFKAIADAGLVHANSMITFVTDPAAYPSVYTTTFMAQMARYWVARFGAYPVTWSIAQEIDADYYGTYAGDAIAPWQSAIDTVVALDDYKHPIIPHQEASTSTDATNSRFASQPWFGGFGAQLQFQDGWDLDTLNGYWTSGHLAIVYETPYEHFWTDNRHSLSALYKAYLSGMYGYGYGMNGLWNDIYSAPGVTPIDAGTPYDLDNPVYYYWWYDGINSATGDQLTYGAQFFQSLPWYTLYPTFDDTDWSSIDTSGGNNFMATNSAGLYVAFFADNSTTTTGQLLQCEDNATYTAEWFNPRTGQTTTVNTSATSSGAAYTIPAKMTTDDWVFTLSQNK